MKRTTLSVVVAALAMPMLAATIPSAAAAPAPAAAKNVPAAAAASHAASSSKVPAPQLALSNYTQVTSGSLADPAGLQVSGTATCAAGFKVVGGGAVIAGTSLAENINGSLPLNNRSWRAYVNNAGSTDGTFITYAICVKQTSLYTQVIGTGVANPAGTQVSATATCPTGTVPYGGGGVSSSLSTLANLNTSIPLSSGWRVDANNASSSDTSVTAYVICGRKPSGYFQKVGTATAINPGTQGNATAVCRGTTLALSGGAFSSSGSTSVDLNTTVPSGSSAWISYENNGSSSANSITPYVVCGKVS